jgi:RNA polymerase sigma-70 factor (ECF subfamily)
MEEDILRHYFDAYFGRLFLYAYTLVKDEAEAKDITQASYIKLWEKRSHIDFATSAKAYLYSAVYHLALNTNRNKKLRQGHRQNLQEQESSDPVYTLEQMETLKRIRRTVDELPPRCREVFLKSRVEGKKYSEIAAEIQISQKTLEAQMGKALKYLREQLQDLLVVLTILLTTI